VQPIRQITDRINDRQLYGLYPANGPSHRWCVVGYAKPTNTAIKRL